MKSELTRRNILVAATGIAATASMMTALATPAAAEQGNMEAAINHLQQALESLRQATPNKGGHRERAMQMCETAIAEVQAGIDYANEHGG